MSVRTLMLATSQQIKGVVRPLGIINPVVGQNGIYDVMGDDGKTFKAYVNMTNDGGYWVQVVRYTVPLPVTIPGKNLIWKDHPIIGFSSNPDDYPSIPAGRIALNPSQEFLFKSGMAAWIDLFGSWQRMATIEKDAIIPATGMIAHTSIGEKMLYPRTSGWGRAMNKEDALGLWTVNGADGPCGGQGRVGVNRICPTFFGPAVDVHSDFSTEKTLYLRASNYEA